MIRPFRNWSISWTSENIYIRLLHSLIGRNILQFKKIVEITRAGNRKGKFENINMGNKNWMKENRKKEKPMFWTMFICRMDLQYSSSGQMCETNWLSPIGDRYLYLLPNVRTVGYEDWCVELFCHVCTTHQ